jgi:hypothetical protein
MARGGRYIADAEGAKPRLADPASEEHSAYPKAEIAKDENGNPVHQRSVPETQEGDGDMAPPAPSRKPKAAKPEGEK